MDVKCITVFICVGTRQKYFSDLWHAFTLIFSDMKSCVIFLRVFCRAGTQLIVI